MGKTQDICNWLNKRSPEILTGVGLIGMAASVVVAVKSTPKAMELIEKEKEVRKDVGSEPPTNFELVKAAGGCYIPAALLGAASICCIIAATRTSVKRNAALTAAYTLSETARLEYKHKVMEKLGERKEREIVDEINKDKVVKHPVQEVIVTGKGDTICYDSISGRYFKSDMDILNKAVNELNRKIVHETYISLNEFYDLIGLDFIKLGDMLGWNVEDGYIDLTYSSILDAAGNPCLVVDYSVYPTYSYK